MTTKNNRPQCVACTVDWNADLGQSECSVLEEMKPEDSYS
jgi:hypothetical protein